MVHGIKWLYEESTARDKLKLEKLKYVTHLKGKLNDCLTPRMAT